jgi:hypothetical protein
MVAVDTLSERMTELRHEKAGGALFFIVAFHVWGWSGLLVAFVSLASTWGYRGRARKLPRRLLPPAK